MGKSGFWGSPNRLAKHVRSTEARRGKLNGGSKTTCKHQPAVHRVVISTGGQAPKPEAVHAVQRNNRLGRSNLRETPTGFEGTIKVEHLRDGVDSVPRQIAASQGVMVKPATITIKRRKGRNQPQPIEF